VEHLSDLRILVVDDHAIWRSFVVAHLQRAGLKVIAVAYDGVQAVYQARVAQPDVIVMDINLPHLNGLQAAAAIRVAVPSAKIVFVSGIDDADVKGAALAAGGHDYVLKSLAGRDLVNVIARVARGGAETA
jgi:two-component system nitrate/nitrite response regulator NarL